MSELTINVKEAIKTCGACPAQWHGVTDDNRRVYARYRYGVLRVAIGNAGDPSEFAGVAGANIFVHDNDDPYHGFMEYGELRRLTKAMISWPHDCRAYRGELLDIKSD